MKRFFTSLKVFFYLLVICLVGAGGFVILRMVKAGPQWVTIHPSSCLGGWENPSLAQGKPDLSEGSLFEEFNEKNSARLSNTNAQIFCGSFPIQAVENTNIQGISLKLSWAVEGARSIAVKDEKKKDKDDEASVIKSINDESEINTEIIITIPDPQTSEQVPDEESTEPEEGTPTETTDSESNEEPSDEGGNDSDSSDSESSDSGDESAFNWNIFGTIVHAETVDEEEKKEEEKIADDVVTTPAQEALFEVKYSTDGKEWSSLGTVTRISLSDAVFSIPTAKLNSWESLKDLQIRIDRLTTLDDPVTYLDGMSLTVTYIPTEPEQSLEVVAIPDTLHISNITAEVGVLPLHVERVDGKETLIVTSTTNIGGLVIYGGDSDDHIVLDTHVEDVNYKIPAESIGLGNFTVVATQDPDHCKYKQRLVCATEAGAVSNSFMIQMYQTPVEPVPVSTDI